MISRNPTVTAEAAATGASYSANGAIGGALPAPTAAFTNGAVPAADTSPIVETGARTAPTSDGTTATR